MTLADLLGSIVEMRGLPRDGFAYNGPEALVLKYGTLRTAHPTRTTEGITLPPGQPRECFLNAWRAATDFPAETLLYTEGYAAAFGIPMEHAWLVHQDTGVVLDPTWSEGTGHVETDYYGISFSTDFMRRWAHRTRQPNVLTYPSLESASLSRAGFITDNRGVVVDVAHEDC